jgi:hypothetical protein
MFVSWVPGVHCAGLIVIFEPPVLAQVPNVSGALISKFMVMVPFAATVTEFWQGTAPARH